MEGKKKKRFVLIGLIMSFLIIGQLKAQDTELDLAVAGNAGGTLTSSSFSIDFTVGEFLTDLYSGSNTQLTQGFHQAGISQISTDQGIVSGVNDVEISDNELSVYPNPCVDRVNVGYDFDSKTEMKVDIYNITGRILLNYSDTFEQGTSQIDLSPYPQGTYFIRFSDFPNNKFKVFKIVKL